MMLVAAAAVVVAVMFATGSVCGKIYICLSKWAPAFADERALLVSFPRRLFGLGFWVSAFLRCGSYTLCPSRKRCYM